MEKRRKVAVVVLCNTFSWSDKVGHNLVLRLAGAQKNLVRLEQTGEVDAAKRFATSRSE
jgi:hypothetical protein